MPGQRHRRSSTSRAPTTTCASSSWTLKTRPLALLPMRRRFEYAFAGPRGEFAQFTCLERIAR
eukprot:478669-Heterocapsa_arctica.AAC.1